MIPKTELRTGDGCGKVLACDGVAAVDIVGGVVIDIDAMDDTKSEMLDEMVSVSEKKKKKNILLKHNPSFSVNLK